MLLHVQSCVKYHGLRSEWFDVKQGNRQGGKSSPLMYLLFINGLIKELTDSRYGMCLYNECVCAPTVADDMILISFYQIWNGLYATNL